MVRQVVELNADGEEIAALSVADVAHTLRGSGLSESDIDRALSELVRRGELTRTESGFTLPELDTE